VDAVDIVPSVYRPGGRPRWPEPVIFSAHVPPGDAEVASPAAAIAAGPLAGSDIVVYLVIAAVVVLCAAIVSLLTARSFEGTRTVLVHLPAAAAWEAVRDFGALHAAHVRGRGRLRITASTLCDGDGAAPGSAWRQRGLLDDSPYWAEIGLVAADAPRALAVRLLRDSLGTERGLARHHLEIRLVPEGDRGTKLVLRVSARLTGVRLPLMQRLAPARLAPLLLDLGMRSVKIAMDEQAAVVTGGGFADTRAGLAGAIPPPSIPSTDVLRDQV
jgi:hypothetical protein